MKKIILNTKWQGKEIICAKTPNGCWGCKDKFSCEPIEFTYDEYADIDKVMENRYGIDEVKCKGR